MESELKVKPVPLGFSRQYLKIDPAQVSAGVANLVRQSGLYFSKPLDDARFQLITTEGMRSEKIKISDTAQIFNLVDATTVRIDLYLSVEQKTPSGRFTLIGPDEHVNLSIDFRKKVFRLEIAVLGRGKMEQIGELLTEGVVLVNFDLPEPHQYLERSLANFLQDHPQRERNIFLIMRFKEEPPFPEIIESVRATCAVNGLQVLRADDKEYTDDLWDNVLTYMYGCDYGIAIFDQINYREFNPDVALEVGFLFAQCKRVLLLKDRAIPVMPADIVGKIYRSFDTYSASRTIRPQITKWLQDYGIGMQE